jgi:hypothetical protein
MPLAEAPVFFLKKRNDSSSAFQLKDKREAEEALS